MLRRRILNLLYITDNGSVNQIDFVDYGNSSLYTLKMARKEAEMGITATYYFRTHDDVFKPDIIREIADLGHEIGYHHILGETEGDY